MQHSWQERQRATAWASDVAWIDSKESDTLDDFDDDLDSDDVVDPVEYAKNKAAKNQAEEERRIKARREIERRNELKALKSELDEWDDLLDEDDL